MRRRDTGVVVRVDTIVYVVAVADLTDVGVFHTNERMSEVDKEKACTGRKRELGLVESSEFLWSTAKVVQSCRLCRCACCLHTEV